MDDSDLPDSRPLLRVMALHALEYCERLFYLEEVEEVRVADERVHAGRAMHERLDEPEEVTRLDLESDGLGLRGRVDAVRTRDGATYPVEHKRGRPMPLADGEQGAWPADRLQAIAYALLLEEHLGEPVVEARVHYHNPSHTVRIPIDEPARADVRTAVARAEELRQSTDRPPVTDNEKKCVRCSLVPVCLPEEGRLSRARTDSSAISPIRLFPADTERHSLHILRPRARLGRSGQALVVDDPDEDQLRRGVRELSDVVVHGFAQITTQALRLCAHEGIPVHYLTTSGIHLAVCTNSRIPVQRRIRQFRALADPTFCGALATRLVVSKIELQLRHAQRILRRREKTEPPLEPPDLQPIQLASRGAEDATDRNMLLGHEGRAARAYFEVLRFGVSDRVDPRLSPKGRTTRPPKDRFNALLSFGYGLLYRDLTTVVLRVGLEPGFGILHQPRSTAYPLVLDLLELFRVPVVDVAVLGAVNRAHFDADTDFEAHGVGVWLTESGRRKLVTLYERRKHEEHRHPALEYSLSWARMMELEARLLEKEWTGEPGLFACLRLH